MEQELRKKAIKRYLQGETPKSIYSDLGRSKNWFFKWLRRYQSGDCHWYKDQSRSPIRRPTALNDIDKQRIICVRQRLESHRNPRHFANNWQMPIGTHTNLECYRRSRLRRHDMAFPRNCTNHFVRSRCKNCRP